MRHIDDGILRRMIDEPFSVGLSARQHYDSCSECKARAEAIGADRMVAMGALSNVAPPADLQQAALRVKAASATNRRSSWMSRVRGNRGTRVLRWSPTFAVSTLAVILVGAVAFTPAASLASGFLGIFQPKQFVPVTVTASQLRTLPDLRKYGTVDMPSDFRPHSYPSAELASTALGTRVETPSYLPSGTPTAKNFQVLPVQTSSFTFSAMKAAATARAHHETLPSMPRGINGSTIRVTTSPAVLTIYGRAEGIPSLLVGQTRSPRVSSSGPSLKTIERYVLHLPGVSPKLAHEIEAIGNPSTALPIPIPVNTGYAHAVKVNGHTGLLVGDNTGIASAVIWSDGGTVHGVAGALTQDQVMKVAESLR